jgi:hypothetical protein
MTISSRFTRAAVAAMSALALFAPRAVSAMPPAPSEPAGARTHVVGTITDFHGKYGIVVRDVHGALVTVQLHQGTVIQPVGLRLERGMVIALTGTASAGAFAADRVDVPNPPASRVARWSDFGLGGGSSGREPSGRTPYAGQDIPPERDASGPLNRPPR